MKLEIQNIGTVEITSLEKSYGEDVSDPLEYEMAIVKLNEKKCLICDPSNTIELCKVIMEDNTIISCFFDFTRGDMNFWEVHGYEYGEYAAEDSYILDELFKYSVENNVFLKIYSDELKNICSKNFVYVLIDYENFDSNKGYKLNKGYATIIKKFLLDYWNDNCEDEENLELKNEFKQEYDNYIKKIDDTLEKLQKEEDDSF